MKVAFSSLACPNWPLDLILQKAKEWGCDGIQLRGLQDEIYLPRHPELSGPRLRETKAKIAEAGLFVYCLGSSAKLSVPEDQWAANADEVKDYIHLAVNLNCPVVRIYGGRRPDLSWGDYVALVSERLYRLCRWTDAFPVRLAIETHDALVRARDLSEILQRVPLPTPGAVWDVHHSFRAGESPSESVQFLGSRILDVHIKDSVPSDGAIRYVPLGKGTVPLTDALVELKKLGYQGPITIEWEKRWVKDLEEPEVALPEMIATVKSWLRQVEPS
ncbi:MAG: sugar phosphate isomerase/epimerase [Armatimonadetes bacterium]|nr:sugar phosphate isomerase/epimerase [Armatimonadota bacterium]MDW8122345.1 sugar phosphate isomerase/epimerase family protein [Armatimonadota bacterium]